MARPIICPHCGQKFYSRKRPAPPHGLTPREFEFLQIFAEEGMSTRKVAERMSIEHVSANRYRDLVYKRLQVHSRAEAVALYTAWKASLPQEEVKDE